MGRLGLVIPTPTIRDPAPTHPLGFPGGCRAFVSLRQISETRLDDPIAGINPHEIHGRIDESGGCQWLIKVSWAGSQQVPQTAEKGGQVVIDPNSCPYGLTSRHDQETPIFRDARAKTLRRNSASRVTRSSLYANLQGRTPPEFRKP